MPISFPYHPEALVTDPKRRGLLDLLHKKVVCSPSIEESTYPALEKYEDYLHRSSKMLSIYPQATVLSQKETPQQEVQLRELGNIQDAVISFTKFIQRSSRFTKNCQIVIDVNIISLLVRAGTTSIRLHCTVPTWSSSTDTCLDLYDLHELKSRFLLFVHDLLQSLRSAGVSASYSLSPSSSSLCWICQKPISVDVLQQLQESSDKFTREQVTLVNVEGGCLVIT